MRNLLLGSLALVLAAAGVHAQVRLPTVPLITKPLSSLQQSLSDVDARAHDTLGQARQLQIGALVRTNPRVIATDPHGNPVVRGELLAYAADAQLPAAIARAGFNLLRAQRLESLHLYLLVLGAPSGLSERKALKSLQNLDPRGTYDYNHIYLGSGTFDQDPLAPVRDAPPDIPTLRAVRLGLIDTGIDRAHPAFRDARIRSWGCNDHPTGAQHGTAVASLMVGRAAAFHGVLPEADLYAADIYCGQPTGGALDALLGAFGWLAQERVPVINVSLVGPKNALLQRAVGELISQGFLIVAAVGNDGPGAPPLYPASYPGVVGVSGVDPQQQVLLEAARGPQVMFASIGSDLAAAVSGGGYTGVRGTSFAAPIVASLLASQLSMPGVDAAQAALGMLMRSALHRGRPGRDLTYGYGIVGIEYRIDPRILKEP